MARCHVCGGEHANHAEECRVPSNLDRFVRVYRRLSAEGRNAELQERLLNYLDLNGRGGEPHLC